MFRLSGFVYFLDHPNRHFDPIEPGQMDIRPGHYTNAYYADLPDPGTMETFAWAQRRNFTPGGGRAHRAKGARTYDAYRRWYPQVEARFSVYKDPELRANQTEAITIFRCKRCGTENHIVPGKHMACRPCAAERQRRKRAKDPAAVELNRAKTRERMARLRADRSKDAETT